MNKQYMGKHMEYILTLICNNLKLNKYNQNMMYKQFHYYN